MKSRNCHTVSSKIVSHPCSCLCRGGSRGKGAGGAHPHPPTPNDLRFSNTTGILRKKKKTMCFIGVEVEQETSAPLPKKNPGSAPALLRKNKLETATPCLFYIFTLCRQKRKDGDFTISGSDNVWCLISLCLTDQFLYCPCNFPLVSLL